MHTRNPRKVCAGGNLDALDCMLQKCIRRMERCQGIAIVENTCSCLNGDLAAFSGSSEEIIPVSASLKDEKESRAALYGQEKASN